MYHVNSKALCVPCETSTCYVPGSSSCHILPAGDRTVEQTKEQTDMLPGHVVHFTDCEVIKIYDPIIQFI